MASQSSINLEKLLEEESTKEEDSLVLRYLWHI
jgi:hypothetical protein